MKEKIYYKRGDSQKVSWNLRRVQQIKTEYEPQIKIDNFPEFNRREIVNNKMPSILLENITSE